MTDPVRLEIGDVAPDFTLPDQDGRPVTLSALRGRATILYFYGEACTPACTKQACDFRDSWDAFATAGYQVLGVSRDRVEKLAPFQRAEALPFPLLSDPERVVHELYGTYGQKQLYGRTVTGVIRSTFVIDERGAIAQALYNIRATGHVGMLRRRLGV